MRSKREKKATECQYLADHADEALHVLLGVCLHLRNRLLGCCGIEASEFVRGEMDQVGCRLDSAGNQHGGILRLRLLWLRLLCLPLRLLLAFCSCGRSRSRSRSRSRTSGTSRSAASLAGNLRDNLAQEVLHKLRTRISTKKKECACTDPTFWMALGPETWKDVTKSPCCCCCGCGSGCAAGPAAPDEDEEAADEAAGRSTRWITKESCTPMDAFSTTGTHRHTVAHYRSLAWSCRPPAPCP